MVETIRGMGTGSLSVYAYQGTEVKLVTARAKRVQAIGEGNDQDAI
jgi:hypothetical protein